MIDTGYLCSKDNKRIFVNTCLGCTGKCLYCYLGKIGYDNSSIVGEVRRAEKLIEEIELAGISRDTLITLGCFSECWDDNNKPETIKLIKYFLQKGNTKNVKRGAIEMAQISEEKNKAQEKQKKEIAKAYGKYAKEFTPKPKYFSNCLRHSSWVAQSARRLLRFRPICKGRAFRKKTRVHSLP